MGVSSTSHRGLSQLLQDHYYESLEDHRELLLLYLQVPLPLVQRRLSEMQEQELQILALISKMWEDFRRTTYQLS